MADAAFNPDEYLQQKVASAAPAGGGAAQFDPDAYLKEKSAPAEGSSKYFPHPSKESWLYDFVTGAQGKDAVEPTTAAELLAPGAMTSSASPAAADIVRKIMGGAAGAVLGGAGWHSGGAIARRLLGGGH